MDFDGDSYEKVLDNHLDCQKILNQILKVPQFKLLNILEKISGEIYALVVGRLFKRYEER